MATRSNMKLTEVQRSSRCCTRAHFGSSENVSCFQTLSGAQGACSSVYFQHVADCSLSQDRVHGRSDALRDLSAAIAKQLTKTFLKSSLYFVCLPRSFSRLRVLNLLLSDRFIFFHAIVFLLLATFLWISLSSF